MANIFDYLNDVAYDSFYDLPVNELDVLALTELTYLAFDDVVTQEPKRLIDLASQIPRDTTMLTNKNRLQLLDRLAQHKRFKNCKLSDFINDIDPELQKQFAAMTYRISLDTYLLVFRGTDDTIIRPTKNKQISIETDTIGHGCKLFLQFRINIVDKV